jgi:D-inositol-3-phosphate glycosyltransferase
LHRAERTAAAGRFNGRFTSLRCRLRATRQIWAPGKVTRSWVDLPQPGALLPAGLFEIEGWALFPSGPPVRVEAWLDDLPLGPARLGMPRSDVRGAIDVPAADVCGFELSADLRAVGPPEGGEAVLRIVATGAAGETLQLDPVPVRVGMEASPGKPQASLLPLPPSHTPRAPERGGHRLLVYAHQLDLGGAQLYLFELLRELLRLDAANPTVVTSIDGPLRIQLEELGVPVHVSSPVPEYDRGAHLGRLEELMLWAEGRDFDLALVNTASSYALPGAELAARLGIPALWAIHESSEPRTLWSSLEPAVQALAEDALAEASIAIFEAESTRRLYEPHLPGRCLTLPYGVALDRIDAERAGFDPSAARREAGIAADAEVLLCLGAVQPRKAQVPLAQAFMSIAARHPRAHLVFVGGWDGATSRALDAFIGSSPLAGRISLIPLTGEVGCWHGIADALVCPSDLESLPRAVLEAMAWETPVLATDVFGLPEVVADGVTGWLCASRDVEQLAIALERALTASDAERKALGRAGRALIEQRHAFDAYARRFAEILDETAAQWRAGTLRSTPSRVRTNGIPA